MALILDGLTKTFQSFPAVNNLTCTFDTGVYGLLGVNGAGKTTVLNMLGGMDTCDEGHIWLDGKEVSATISGSSPNTAGTTLALYSSSTI